MDGEIVVTRDGLAFPRCWQIAVTRTVALFQLDLLWFNGTDLGPEPQLSASVRKCGQAGELITPNVKTPERSREAIGQSGQPIEGHIEHDDSARNLGGPVRRAIQDPV